MRSALEEKAVISLNVAISAEMKRALDGTSRRTGNHAEQLRSRGASPPCLGRRIHCAPEIRKRNLRVNSVVMSAEYPRFIRTLEGFWPALVPKVR